MAYCHCLLQKEESMNFRFLLCAMLVASALSTNVQAGAEVLNEKCGDCHAREVKSASNPAMHASRHAALGIKDCFVCHERAELEKSHADVAVGEKRFVAAKRYKSEFCIRCHGPLEVVAKRTEGERGLKDTAGRVVNPHALPDRIDHAKLKDCGICHREHKKQPDVMRSCTGCHHTTRFESCSQAQCHSGR